MYGLDDPSIPSQRVNEIVQSVFLLFNKTPEENILKEEFVQLLESGGDLPDCEFDGHHGDDEWEVTPPSPGLLNSSFTCPFHFVWGWSGRY